MVRRLRAAATVKSSAVAQPPDGGQFPNLKLSDLQEEGAGSIVATVRGNDSGVLHIQEPRVTYAGNVHWKKRIPKHRRQLDTRS